MTDRAKSNIFYGWVIVAASFILLFLTWGFQYSYGIFLPELCQDLDWTTTLVSGAYSLFMFCHAVAYLLAGKLNDKYGPRLTLAICIVTLSAGYASMSTINSPWQLYLFYGIVIGIGNGFCFVPVTSTVSRWFVARRGMALGIATAGVGLGTLALAPFAQALIARFGWETSYLFIAGIILVVGLPVSRLMRLQPSDRGLLPDGAKEIVRESESSIDSPSTIDFTLRQASKTRGFWLLFSIAALFVFVVQMVMVHLKLYVTNAGIDPMAAATMVGFVGGASCLGRVVMGSISDKIGRIASFLIACLLIGVMMLWLVKARQPWQFYLFSAIFGFGYGAWVPLNPAITADWFGTKSHGTIFGVLTLATGIGGAVGPLLGGHIYDSTGSYSTAIVIGMVLAFVAAACSLALKAPSASSA
jgi:Sugar phosphate permease